MKKGPACSAPDRSKGQRYFTVLLLLLVLVVTFLSVRIRFTGRLVSLIAGYILRTFFGCVLGHDSLLG